jgi:hypothetical protein
MNITEEQIRERLKQVVQNKFGCQLHEMESTTIKLQHAFNYSLGYEQAMKWMQEQLQPKWITVTGIADLPTDTESYWCEVSGQVILLSADHMRRGTVKIKRYTSCIKPVPPKQ